MTLILGIIPDTVIIMAQLINNSLKQETSSDRSRWTALVVLCIGMLMIVLDATIVNVALPSIQDDLGFSQSSLAWVVNAYLITFGGLLLLAGRLGDLVGRRDVFLSGLVLFTAASLACGLAQSEASVKTVRPARKTRRWPIRSPIRPARSSRPPNGIM